MKATGAVHAGHGRGHSAACRPAHHGRPARQRDRLPVQPLYPAPAGPRAGGAAAATHLRLRRLRRGDDRRLCRPVARDRPGAAARPPVLGAGELSGGNSGHVATRGVGKTAATAYDATHGFSDQFIVEIEVLQKIAAEAGLHSDADYFKKYPETDYATVSINLLRGK